MPDETTPVAPDTSVTDTTQTPWYDRLPDDLKADETISRYKGKTDAQIGTEILNLKRALGSEKFVVPGKDATDQDWDLVYNILGRPEKPDDYQIDKIETDPKIGLDESDQKWFAQTAHKLGLNSKQASQLFSQYHDHLLGKVNVVNDDARKQYAINDQELRTEFGQAYHKKLALAQSVLKNYFDESSVQAMEGTGLMSNAPFIKGLVSLGASLGEDRLIGMGNAAVKSALTPSEARSQINAIISDPQKQKAWLNPSDPDHKAVREEMNRLYEMVP